ncbi:basic salivary proline-rich protein 1-like [Ammospiza caudacuta]|uniref:basic salivary proline-rich protein 1-like n=1 Tax=Ammospiza caudacuta TaxID=2857398 RepID=UPI0027393C29|nr:basic salivary proline-rich protein 1-like [Ammospiza caudacuta]
MGTGTGLGGTGALRDSSGTPSAAGSGWSRPGDLIGRGWPGARRLPGPVAPVPRGRVVALPAPASHPLPPHSGITRGREDPKTLERGDADPPEPPRREGGKLRHGGEDTVSPCRGRCRGVPHSSGEQRGSPSPRGAAVSPQAVTRRDRDRDRACSGRRLRPRRGSPPVPHPRTRGGLGMPLANTPALTRPRRCLHVGSGRRRRLGGLGGSPPWAAPHPAQPGGGRNGESPPRGRQGTGQGWDSDTIRVGDSATIRAATATLCHGDIPEGPPRPTRHLHGRGGPPEPVPVPFPSPVDPGRARPVPVAAPPAASGSVPAARGQIPPPPQEAGGAAGPGPAAGMPEDAGPEESERLGPERHPGSGSGGSFEEAGEDPARDVPRHGLARPRSLEEPARPRGSPTPGGFAARSPSGRRGRLLARASLSREPQGREERMITRESPPNHPRFIPRITPKSPPNHPRFIPRITPKSPPNHPRFIPRITPKSPPNHPRFIPRITPESPPNHPRITPGRPPLPALPPARGSGADGISELTALSRRLFTPAGGSRSFGLAAGSSPSPRPGHGSRQGQRSPVPPRAPFVPP